jgi:hypothetical protein
MARIYDIDAPDLGTMAGAMLSAPIIAIVLGQGVARGE